MFTYLISCHRTDLRKQNNVPGSWKLGQLGPRMMGDLKFLEAYYDDISNLERC